MATASPDEALPGPSGHRETPRADRPADPSIFRKVATSVSNDWKWLGRELGIEEAKLVAIRLDYFPEGVEEMAYQVLEEWQSRLTNAATVTVLAERLTTIGKAKLAFEILEMAKESKTRSSISQLPPKMRSSRRSGLQEHHILTPPMTKKRVKW